MDNELRAALREMTYESSSGRGKRGLMEHHVEAIMQTIMPILEPVFEAAWKYEGLCK